jgi:hypothetical protein
MRNRESVRAMSIECLDRLHGDCENESCECSCHLAAESDEDDQDESPCA